jgi:predicted nucleic acid-binding protein
LKVVIADTTSLISLILVDKLDLVEKSLGQYFIPEAVWNELLNYSIPKFDIRKFPEIKNHVIKIRTKNYLHSIMDLGESEAVTLYNEMDADFLLTDDNKARQIAESIGVNCIGSIGLLIKSKEKGLLTELRNIFEIWVKSGRYFSKNFLNEILKKYNEEQI